MFKNEPRFLNSYEVTEVQAIFYINRSKVRFIFIYRQFLNTHSSLQKKKSNKKQWNKQCAEKKIGRKELFQIYLRQSQSQLLKVINLPSLKFQMNVIYPTHIQALGVTVYKQAWIWSIDRLFIKSRSICMVICIFWFKLHSFLKIKAVLNQTTVLCADAHIRIKLTSRTWDVIHSLDVRGYMKRIYTIAIDLLEQHCTNWQ